MVESLMLELRGGTASPAFAFSRALPASSRIWDSKQPKREELPDKIYKDCLHCPKLTDCDEVAMVIGKIPSNTNGLHDSRILIPLVRPTILKSKRDSLPSLPIDSCGIMVALRVEQHFAPGGTVATKFKLASDYDPRGDQPEAI